jgi:hypothetical protein
VSERAPRGARQAANAFLEVLGRVPAERQKQVARAALALIRDVGKAQPTKKAATPAKPKRRQVEAAPTKAKRRVAPATTRRARAAAPAGEGETKTEA